MDQGFYGEAELSSIPELSRNLSRGCGNSTGFANLQPGETVVDFGCGGGIDVILAAHKVGSQRTGLSDRMMLLAAGSEQQIKEDSVDFVTALYVIEIVDQPAFFNDMCRAMKPGAKILMLEPRFHVAEKEFRRSVEMAEATGLVLTSDVDFSRRLSVVLSKP